MDGEHDPQIRIVYKKKKGHGGGGHGGAWKVAYADFVTAMMALFIVLWLVGQKDAVKQAISAYFKDPGAFSESSRSGGIHKGASQPLPKPEPGPANDLSSEMEKLKIESKKIEEMISSVPTFKQFKDKIQITVTKDGMRIELIENSDGLFFDVGSAKVKTETIRLLRMIATEVGKLPNPVLIEGYTDARPYSTDGYSNWELSADRANAARKHLEENGLRKDQIKEVRGYADRLLKNPDKPYDSSNRRVNITVMIPQKAEQVATPAPVNVKPAQGQAK